MKHPILDRPIAFHRAFAQLTGSITAGLMLSQAVYWQQRCKSDDGWWWKTRDQWTEETFMCRSEQQIARKRLCKFSWWQEEARGLPRKMWFRVNLDKLLDEVSKIGTNCQQEGNILPHSRQDPANSTAESCQHLNVTKTSTENTSKEGADAPKKDDADIVIWSELLCRLTESGVSERQARSLIGKWRKESGNDALVSVTIAARKVAPTEPVAWITKALMNHKPPPPKTTHSEFDPDPKRMSLGSDPDKWANWHGDN